MLTERIAQAHRSPVGRCLLAISGRVGGPVPPALFNLICTAALGFVITFPIYELGGPIAALPTAAFTVILLIIIAICMANHLIGGPFSGPLLRSLLTFGILFSLPFGLFSLHLLHSMAEEEKRNKKKKKR